MVLKLTGDNAKRHRFIFFLPASVPALQSQRTRLGKMQCTHTGTRDVCAGRNHMTWSLSCALAEALHLNRTLVVPNVLCCHQLHCGGEERCAPSTSFFRLEGPNVLLESQLLAAGVRPTLVGCETTTAALLHAQNVAVRYKTPCTRYYFQRCEGVSKMSGGVHLERGNASWLPWTLPWREFSAIREVIRSMKATLANATAAATVRCLHVRRGDKLAERYWPCTGVDTSPSSIERTLLDRWGVEPGSPLYVASNEVDRSFFAPLNRTFRIFQMHDFAIDASALGPHGTVGIDYGVCHRLPTIQTYRDTTSPRIPYLTTDPKDPCSGKNYDSRCRPRNYECMTRGNWSLACRIDVSRYKARCHAFDGDRHNCTLAHVGATPCEFREGGTCLLGHMVNSTSARAHQRQRC